MIGGRGRVYKTLAVNIGFVVYYVYINASPSGRPAPVFLYLFMQQVVTYFISKIPRWSYITILSINRFHPRYFASIFPFCFSIQIRGRVAGQRQRGSLLERWPPGEILPRATRGRRRRASCPAAGCCPPAWPSGRPSPTPPAPPPRTCPSPAAGTARKSPS